MKIRKIVPVCFFALTIVGCGNASLTPAGEQVQVRDTLYPGDLFRYENIGSISSYNMNSANDCLNDIRNQAAMRDADFVHTTSIESTYCPWDTWDNQTREKKCFNMHADAFRRKSWP